MSDYLPGASFVAAKRVLQARFGAIPIYGLFLARRALPDIADEFGIIEE